MFYYFGWWIYGCFEQGIIPFCRATSSTRRLERSGDGELLLDDLSVGSESRPNLQDHISGVFWAAFLLFSWTTASIMSGALIERVRLSAYLVLGSILGSVIWTSTPRGAGAPTASSTCATGSTIDCPGLVVHGVAGAFTLGVLLNLGPRIGKYTKEGLARTFRPHNLHLTILGLMLIFTGSTRSTRPVWSSSRRRLPGSGTSTSTRRRLLDSPSR